MTHSMAAATQRLLAFPLDWSQSDGLRVRDKGLANLEAALQSPMEVGRAVVGATLLSTWYSTLGQAQVLQNELGGWQQIRLGHDFARTGFLLSHRLFEHDPRPDKPVRKTALAAARIVAMALALQDPQSGPLLSVFNHRMDAGTLGGIGSSFPAFIRRLTAEHADEPLPNTDLGPYSGLFAASDAELNSALESALDYHVAGAAEYSDAGTGEFELGPDEAFPYEVLAFVRVRAARIPTSKLQSLTHPLWQTPLCTTAPDKVWPHDPMLERFVEYATTVKPPHPDQLMARYQTMPRPTKLRLGDRLRRWFGN